LRVNNRENRDSVVNINYR